MSETTIASMSGLTKVVVTMDEVTGKGDVQITTYGSVNATVPLPGEYAGTPDAQPYSEYLAGTAAAVRVEASPVRSRARK